ncbi:hypothetical protein AHF37_00758 [Paragonimus kellicotti]|nr:hypothetical protein AHF37_00758 [Paragonimus kellicotti]
MCVLHKLRLEVTKCPALGKNWEKRVLIVTCRRK